MTITLKKQKYVIPIILLPFLCLFFYVYKSSFGKSKPVIGHQDSLQTGVASVSAQVSSQTLASKLDAFRERYSRSQDGYTAINDILDERADKTGPQAPYNDSENQVLDSIAKTAVREYGKTGGDNRSGPGNFPDVSPAARKPKGDDQQDQALAAALAKMNRPQDYSGTLPKTQQTPDPMQLFRQQMALVDSMGKAADPEYKAELIRKNQEAKTQQAASVRQPLPVVKAAAASSVFNTVTAGRQEQLITAIIDQDITGYAGSRLRLRLLEDLLAGRFLIKKGTYLYAQVSGFSGQRVNLSITTIMQGGHILPVKLEVYDNDGLPGLYVPASAFREFTKELGGDASGSSLQQQAENNGQLVMSVLQKMFQSTTTAVSKLIRQNKAKLKYNTLVYLIDPVELKNQHQD
jgi:conjugative transposon TraM protein